MTGQTIYVLLPTCKSDSADYLSKSLDSVLGQTYPNVKILLGIDGPIDGQLDTVVEEYERNEHVEVIRFKENRGLACVLNDLVARSRELGAEFVARMDADDQCMDYRIEKQLKYMLHNPDVDVVGGSIEEIDENGKRNGKKVQYPLTHDECRKFFRYRDPLAHPATFFRMRYFEKAGRYRPEYRKNQDTMLWYDGFRNGCVFANLPETVLLFRVAPDFYRRRNGWKRAKQMLTDRLKMNKILGYDISANLFAIAMAMITLSPTWVKKILYKAR